MAKKKKKAAPKKKKAAPKRKKAAPKALRRRRKTIVRCVLVRRCRCPDFDLDTWWVLATWRQISLQFLGHAIRPSRGECRDYWL